MHREVRDFCRKVRAAMPERFMSCRVLDIGSLDVNGCNRGLFWKCKYIGIDLAPGRNVDVVCRASQVEGSSLYDTIMCTECLEHDSEVGATLDAIVRLVRHGGLAIVTCATEPRMEHGTTVSTPMDSPFTHDYYENVEPQLLLNFGGAHFSRFEVEVHADRGDLYFWGTR